MAYFVVSLILTIFFLFFEAEPVFAIETPSLINPSNNSTITSVPTFSWQAIPGSSGYNILIDDEPTVTSPYAKNPYYPANPSYSPQSLNPGTYYWKVKAKDSNGIWGSFSNIWSFTLLSSSPAPTPSPSQSPTPTPPTSTATASFIISNTPTQINSDQSFKVSISLSLPSNPNAIFYLKGAFKKSDSSNYFGKTLVGSAWVKNGSNFSEQYKLTTDSSGNWSANIEAKPDSEDSGFTETDDYVFKVGRYTSTGSGPIWSNEATIKIVSVASSEQGGTTTEFTTNSPAAENKQVSSTTVTDKIASKTNAIEKQITYRIATVAGKATQSAANSTTSQVEVKSKQQFNFLIVVGIFLIISGFSSLFYIYLQRKKEI